MRDLLIIRFGRYTEHLEFLLTWASSEKYWEYRQSMINFWTYKCNKLEYDIELFEE